MSGPAPQDDFIELAQLASRIAKHLTANPKDQQARDDLRYVTSRLGGNQGAAAAANAQDVRDASGTPTPNPGMAIASGVGQAALDIPRGALQAVMHPIQTAGQLTGIGNYGHVVDAFRDPEASGSERLDAIMRALPGVNIGYGAERGLMDATGATGSPAPLQEQAHRAGNVASLALLGVKPTAPLKYAVRNFVPPMLRPAILDRFAGVSKGAKTAETAAAVDPDAALRSQLVQGGQVPAEALDAAIAGIKRARVAPIVAQDVPRVPAYPEPMDVPTAIRTGAVSPGGPRIARSYKELENLIEKQKVPPDQVKVGYYTRGGLLQESVPPGPATTSPRGLLGASALDRTNPTAVAAWLKDQVELAQAFGQPITAEALQKLLEGFDPKVIAAVRKLL